MTRKKKWFKKKRRRKRKFIIEIRTKARWKVVELLSSNGNILTVRLPTGEMIRRKRNSRVRWGKTKKITKGLLELGKKKKEKVDSWSNKATRSVA